MYAWARQCLNYGEQESETGHDSDISVTLKQGQGHQTCNELVDPKQGYNNAEFKAPCLNSVREKANDKICQQSPLHTFEKEK